jgi:hypothetical protein
MFFEELQVQNLNYLGNFFFLFLDTYSWLKYAAYYRFIFLMIFTARNTKQKMSFSLLLEDLFCVP